MSGRFWSRGVLMLAALALTACAARPGPSPTEPAADRGPGRIAYLGYDGNVYVSDADGGGRRPITADARVGAGGYLIYNTPIWSADNRQLAFAAYEGQGNQNPSLNRLFVASADGAALREAYASPAFMIYYYWSPDAGRVGLLSEAPRQTLAFSLVPADGGPPQMVDTGAPFYWTWAPDGRAALVHANGEAGRLALLEFGETIIESSLDVVPTAFKAPAFSPDGRQVLVAGQTADGGAALLLVERDGRGVRTLAETEDEVAFAWSPDGRRVAYLDAAQLAGPLVVLDLAGRADPVTVREEVFAFFWSPDGRSLAYLVQTQAAPGSGQPELAWQLRLLDAASGETRTALTFQPTDHFLRLLPYFDQYHQSLTIWSPDSRRLVVPALECDDDQGEEALIAWPAGRRASHCQGAPGLWVVPVEGGGEPRRIADAVMGVWSWR